MERLNDGAHVSFLASDGDHTPAEARLFVSPLDFAVVRTHAKHLASGRGNDVVAFPLDIDELIPQKMGLP